jgi:hypothetical protein
MSGMRLGSTRRDLRADIEACGYFPDLVEDAVVLAVGEEDLLHRVAQLADDLPQLAAVSLSPCIASRSGVTVLGARVVIAPTDDRRDPLARTL